MTTDNLADIVYLTKNTEPVSVLSEILGAAHGAQNADYYLHEKDSHNNRVNVPLRESETPYESDDEVELLLGEETSEEVVLETPHEYDDIVNLMSDDDEESEGDMDVSDVDY